MDNTQRFEHRLRFAKFLEGLAEGNSSLPEWERFIVQHYSDEFLEEMRRCTVRLMQNRLPYRAETDLAREALRCWAMAIRSSCPRPSDGDDL